MAGSVRRQLIASLVFFAFALSALFAVVTMLVFYRVEDRMLQRRLEQMLVQPPVEGEPVALQFVGPPEAAPPPFAERLVDAAPGYYEWEEEDDRETHVLLIADPETAERRVAIARFNESEATQNRFLVALAIGVAITCLLALLLARYLAVLIVSPIERLTERLATGPLDAVVPNDLVEEPRNDEIGTLARALQQAGERLTAAAERERRFLREASHELRTPITVIQGVSDLLRESIDPGDKVNLSRLERLERSLRRMNTSVLSLLAMARAEYRSTVDEMPPFRQQLEDLIDEARSLAPPGVEVTCDASGEQGAGFAASMLIVVLSNLTRNAVQHSGSESVQVTVEPHRAQVIDHGRGLPPTLLEQLHSAGPQPDVGIGLATVQRICRRFGWGFEIDCPDEGGTVVTVELSPDRDGKFNNR